MKRCNKCFIFKDLNDFYKNKGMPDGVLNQCKVCVLAAQKAFREENRELMRERDFLKNKNLSTERRKRRYEYSKNWRKENPEKYAAHSAVTAAKKNGTLKRADCELCGDKKAEAHHDDYSKPLSVRWLCSVHHKERHRELGW